MSNRNTPEIIYDQPIIVYRQILIYPRDNSFCIVHPVQMRPSNSEMFSDLLPSIPHSNERLPHDEYLRVVAGQNLTNLMQWERLIFEELQRCPSRRLYLSQKTIMEPSERGGYKIKKFANITHKRGA